MCSCSWILLHLDMKERRACYVCYRRANLLSGVDNIDAKCIHCIPTDIIPVNAGDQHLALMVVHEQPSNHCADLYFQLQLWNRPRNHKNLPKVLRIIKIVLLFNLYHCKINVKKMNCYVQQVAMSHSKRQTYTNIRSLRTFVAHSSVI